jgi:hypothetical protein
MCDQVPDRAFSNVLFKGDGIYMSVGFQLWRQGRLSMRLGVSIRERARRGSVYCSKHLYLDTPKLHSLVPQLGKTLYVVHVLVHKVCRSHVLRSANMESTKGRAPFHSYDG